MVEAILKSDLLKTALKALDPLVSEARFHFNEGIHTRAVDPTNVAMVIVEVPYDSFEVFKAEKETIVGFDIARLYDILKAFKKDELVDLKLDKETVSIKSSTVTYSVSLIDPTAIRKEPKVPDLILPARITLDAADFRKAITFAEKLSDQATFRTDSEGFYIEAEGDIEKLTYHLDKAELIEFNDQEARSVFAIEYLKEFAKIASSGDPLTIYLGTNSPGRFCFELHEGQLKVEYLLAPRIEAEVVP